MTIQEKITLASAVIAVISMLVTVVIFRLNYNQAKRISEITLKSNYYNKIFDLCFSKRDPFIIFLMRTLLKRYQQLENISDFRMID